MAKRKDQVQGEGDYEAARRYDKAQREFVESGRAEPAAHDAQPRDEAEAQALQQAEQAGRSRARGEDPAIRGGSGGSGATESDPHGKPAAPAKPKRKP